MRISYLHDGGGETCCIWTMDDYAVTNQTVSTLDTLVELEDTLYTLRDNYRNVIILRLIQGFSVSDTAQILGWTKTKVRLTLYRAAKRLRQEFGQDSDHHNVKEGDSHEIR